MRRFIEYTVKVTSEAGDGWDGTTSFTANDYSDSHDSTMVHLLADNDPFLKAHWHSEVVPLCKVIPDIEYHELCI